MSSCTLIHAYMAPCRQLKPPRLSLVHLIRLAELTLSGDESSEVMLELLRSRPAPVLPGSLRVLRLDVEDISCQQQPR